MMSVPNDELMQSSESRVLVTVRETTTLLLPIYPSPVACSLVVRFRSGLVFDRCMRLTSQHRSHLNHGAMFVDRLSQVVGALPTLCTAIVARHVARNPLLPRHQHQHQQQLHVRLVVLCEFFCRISRRLVVRGGAGAVARAATAKSTRKNVERFERRRANRSA
jgi:hypothetical protein